MGNRTVSVNGIRDDHSCLPDSASQHLQHSRAKWQDKRRYRAAEQGNEKVSDGCFDSSQRKSSGLRPEAELVSKAFFGA